MLGRRAVGEEEDLLVGLVAHLERGARVDDDDSAGLDVDALHGSPSSIVSVPRSGTKTSS